MVTLAVGWWLTSAAYIFVHFLFLSAFLFSYEYPY